MSESRNQYCPECDTNVEATAEVGRRQFLRQTATLAAGAMVGATPAVRAGVPGPRPVKAAEELVAELFQSLNVDQRRTLLLPWNHGQGSNALPTRLRMFNGAINNQRIGAHYTRAQQEMIERILRSISSGEEGFHLLTRGGTYDGSRSLQGCGAHFFGEPGAHRQFAFVFAGHHLTVRCDGNSEPDSGFGGPMYYGHSPNGYSQRNLFYYQTQKVLDVFDALSENQRRDAVIVGSPGEHYDSVRFRKQGEAHPGLAVANLDAGQRRLVESVMQAILSPFRREDADEVMALLRRNGGLERIHLAFYRDREAVDNDRWHFWRLEGPGFVWNYRVLPHVHCYVNIARAPQA